MVLLWLRAPLVPINGTDPCVKPEIASEVAVAFVIVPLVALKFVVVAFVMVPLPAKKLLEVAFVLLAFVVKKLVEVLLVITDEVANNVPGNVRVFTADR